MIYIWWKHIVESERGCRWQYSGTLHAVQVRLHARKRTPVLCTRIRARAHTHTHRHTHTQICNNYSFSTATVVTWTRLIITLHVHCLSCSGFKLVYVIFPEDGGRAPKHMAVRIVRTNFMCFVCANSCFFKYKCFYLFVTIVRFMTRSIL